MRLLGERYSCCGKTRLDLLVAQLVQSIISLEDEAKSSALLATSSYRRSRNRQGGHERTGREGP